MRDAWWRTPSQRICWTDWLWDGTGSRRATKAAGGTAGTAFWDRKRTDREDRQTGQAAGLCCWDSACLLVTFYSAHAAALCPHPSHLWTGLGLTFCFSPRTPNLPKFLPRLCARMPAALTGLPSLYSFCPSSYSLPTTTLLPFCRLAHTCLICPLPVLPGPSVHYLPQHLHGSHCLPASCLPCGCCHLAALYTPFGHLFTAVWAGHDIPMASQ